MLFFVFFVKHSMGTPSVDTPILTEDHSEANLPTSEAAIEEKLSEVRKVAECFYHQCLIVNFFMVICRI